MGASLGRPEGPAVPGSPLAAPTTRGVQPTRATRRTALPDPKATGLPVETAPGGSWCSCRSAWRTRKQGGRVLAQVSGGGGGGEKLPWGAAQPPAPQSTLTSTPSTAGRPWHTRACTHTYKHTHVNTHTHIHTHKQGSPEFRVCAPGSWRSTVGAQQGTHQGGPGPGTAQRERTRAPPPRRTRLLGACVSSSPAPSPRARGRQAQQGLDWAPAGSWGGREGRTPRSVGKLPGQQAQGCTSLSFFPRLPNRSLCSQCSLAAPPAAPQEKDRGASVEEVGVDDRCMEGSSSCQQAAVPGRGVAGQRGQGGRTNPALKRGPGGWGGLRPVGGVTARNATTPSASRPRGAATMEFCTWELGQVGWQVPILCWPKTKSPGPLGPAPRPLSTSVPGGCLCEPRPDTPPPQSQGPTSPEYPPAAPWTPLIPGETHMGPQVAGLGWGSAAPVASGPPDQNTHPLPTAPAWSHKPMQSLQTSALRTEAEEAEAPREAPGGGGDPKATQRPPPRPGCMRSWLMTPLILGELGGLFRGHPGNHLGLGTRGRQWAEGRASTPTTAPRRTSQAGPAHQRGEPPWGDGALRS